MEYRWRRTSTEYLRSSPWVLITTAMSVGRKFTVSAEGHRVWCPIYHAPTLQGRVGCIWSPIPSPLHDYPLHPQPIGHHFIFPPYTPAFTRSRTAPPFTSPHNLPVSYLWSAFSHTKSPQSFRLPRPGAQVHSAPFKAQYHLYHFVVVYTSSKGVQMSNSATGRKRRLVPCIATGPGENAN